MKPIIDALTVLKAYGKAMEVAFERTVETLPLMSTQYATMKAREKLESSQDQYINALNAEIKGDVLVVEIDPEDWLANAVESGADAFDMKVKHLASPRARTSKKGYRYMIIPMGKDPNKKGPDTNKGKFYQKRLQDALKKPNLGNSFFNYLPNGSMVEMQKVMTTDPFMSGLYKTRQHDPSKSAAVNKKQKWGYVMFRVMSDNPSSAGTWQHPGIRPQHILKDTERWLNNNMGDIFEAFLHEELDKFLKV